MLSLTARVNGALKKLQDRTETFFYGNFYPVIFSLITFLFWALDMQLVGFGILILVGSFVLIVFDDMTPIIPLLFLVPMTLRNSAIFNDTLPPYLTLIVAAVALIFNVIKSPKTIKFDLITAALICVIITFLIGGIFSPHLSDYVYGLPFLAISGIAMIAIHIFFTNKIKLNDKVDLKHYLCFSLLTAINLACCQLVYAKVHVELFGPTVFIFPGFCWANTNHIGNLILLAVPICCYLLTRAKSIWFYAFNFIFLYFCVFLSKSDGATATLIALTPIVILESHLKVSRKNHLPLKIFWLVVCSLAVLFLAYMFLFQKQALIEYWETSSDDSGRIPLYESAIELIKQFPVFGVGLGHGTLVAGEVHKGYFHSTFFHVAACTGFVGVASYVFLYFARIKGILKGRSDLGLFTFIAFLMFSVYGMIENSEFNVVVIYLTVLITVTALTAKQGKEDFPLPLHKKFFNHYF